MKIKELQISNILSFKYFENIADATKITFDNDLNIFIGENGAGKSTALEVINFIFKRVLFTQFNINRDLYSNKNLITNDEKKQILVPANNNTYSEFRLEPNWNTENSTQKIRLVIQLDDIDKANTSNLITNMGKIESVSSSYTKHIVPFAPVTQDEYTVEITLNKMKRSFSSSIFPSNSDSGYLYLVNYNFYKELINFYNYENPQQTIPPLYESFTLIGGYRNYNSFNPSIALSSSSAEQQIQNIRNQEYGKSLNSNEQTEPLIFNLVRLRIAGTHYELYGVDQKGDDYVEQANNQPFLTKINNRLKLVNLEVKIQFTNKRSWEYSFQFFDLKRNKPISDINSLSAGQKSIIHLVFEAYGRGDLKGGLVIIDEPEIHLHYQFQNEYLLVINEINLEQKCQYVLVTHSESLISSSTIHKVRRFALGTDNNTVVKSPNISTNQKTLIKILDNSRSTYAFFAKKIILVEGENDRYFFKSLIQELKPNLNQEIAVLDIMGKDQYDKWKEFFEAFGLTVYFVGDLDVAYKVLYPIETPIKLHTEELVTTFISSHPNLETEIEQKYSEKIYILKRGDLEHYLDIHNKGLPETIKFCNENLKSYLVDETNDKSKEIKFILEEITKI